MNKKLLFKLNLQTFAEDGEDKNAELVQKVEALTTELNSVKGEVTSLKEDNKKLNDELTSAKSKLEETEKTLKETREAYKDMFVGDDGKPKKKEDDKTPKSTFDLIAECELK